MTRSLAQNVARAQVAKFVDHQMFNAVIRQLDVCLNTFSFIKLVQEIHWQSTVVALVVHHARKKEESFVNQE